MANTYKVLGQVNPAATTLTSLYTVPASTSTVASTLTVCNFGVSTTVRVAVRPAAAGVAAGLTSSHYVLYDTSITPTTHYFSLLDCH